MKKLPAIAVIIVVICISASFVVIMRHRSRSNILPPEIVKASEEFKKQEPVFRHEPGKKLMSYLKDGMSKKQVEELLGEPASNGSSANQSFYPIGLSDGIFIDFDENGNVIRFQGPGKSFSSGIEANWPLLRVGISKEDVVMRLGGPQKQLDDERVWHYIPSNDPTVFIVTFDENDKVEKLETTETKAE